MITLASSVFRVLLPILSTSLRFLRIFGFIRVTGCGDPSFLAYPHVFLTCGPFIGFLGFFGVRQGYSCVCVDRRDDSSADSSASLAQCSYGGGFFFPRISRFSRWFGIVLGIFTFLPRLHFWCCLFFGPPAYSPLSCSPTVTSLGGFSCRPPSLVVPVFVFGVFLSVAAVLCLILPF